MLTEGDRKIHASNSRSYPQGNARHSIPTTGCDLSPTVALDAPLRPWTTARQVGPPAKVSLPARCTIKAINPFTVKPSFFIDAGNTIHIYPFFIFESYLIKYMFSLSFLLVLVSLLCVSSHPISHLLTIKTAMHGMT